VAICTEYGRRNAADGGCQRRLLSGRGLTEGGAIA
jgi:hypothetical protein